MFGDQSVLVIFAGIAQELYGNSTHHCKQAFWLLSLIPKGINNNQHFLDTTLLLFLDLPTEQSLGENQELLCPQNVTALSNI